MFLVDFEPRKTVRIGQSTVGVRGEDFVSFITQKLTEIALFAGNPLCDPGASGRPGGFRKFQ